MTMKALGKQETALAGSLISTIPTGRIRPCVI